MECYWVHLLSCHDCSGPGTPWDVLINQSLRVVYQNNLSVKNSLTVSNQVSLDLSNVNGNLTIGGVLVNQGFATLMTVDDFVGAIVTSSFPASSIYVAIRFINYGSIVCQSNNTIFVNGIEFNRPNVTYTEDEPGF